MKRTASGCLARVALLSSLLCAAAPCAGATQTENAKPVPWLLTLYAGRYTDQRLLEDVLGQNALHFEQDWLLAAALARPVYTGDCHDWEIEGQLAKHAGEQTHWETNGLVIYRWTCFPWNGFLRTSAAIGDGLSYATAVPSLELASHTNVGAQRLLNYLLIETTFAPAWAKDWSLVVRIHHRSGIFGLFGGVHGGSEVIAVGVKITF